MTASENPKGNPSDKSNSSDKAKLLAVHSLAGPFLQKVKVQYYADRSIRFRVLDAGPMVLTSSFLSGKDKDVVLQVSDYSSPKGKTSTNLKQLVIHNAESSLYQDDVSEVLLDETTGEIKCSFYVDDAAHGGVSLYEGKLLFKPNLEGIASAKLGESHAHISVPCPGGWEFIEDEDQEAQHAAAKKTYSAWIGQKVRVFDDGVPLYVTIDAIVCSCCGEVNSTPWEVQQGIKPKAIAFNKHHVAENIARLVLSDSTYILAPERGVDEPRVYKIRRVNDLFEKDRWDLRSCLETRYDAASSKARTLGLDSNMNKHYREWADLFSSTASRPAAEASGRETEDTSQLIQKHLGKAADKKIGKGTAKRGVPTSKSDLLKVSVLGKEGVEYTLEIVSIDDDIVRLSDGTFILAPYEEDKVIYRAGRTKEDVKFGRASRYIEARCPGQNNYQEWAALFPNQEIEIKTANPDGKAVVWSNKDKRIEGKQG